MVKRVWIITIIIVFCVVAIAFIFARLDLIPLVIYPTKSSPHMLSIVGYDVVYPNKPVITLKYVNNLQIKENILEIKNGVQTREPQTYVLPKIDNGKIEVKVELGDIKNSTFILNYDNAEDLYQRGLLIYLDLANHFSNNAQFVCLVSGQVTTCYSRVTAFDEWTNSTKIPSLKTIPPREPPPDVVVYSGWKENKWAANDNNKTEE